MRRPGLIRAIAALDVLALTLLLSGLGFGAAWGEAALGYPGHLYLVAAFLKGLEGLVNPNSLLAMPMSAASVVGLPVMLVGAVFWPLAGFGLWRWLRRGAWWGLGLYAGLFVLAGWRWLYYCEGMMGI